MIEANLTEYIAGTIHGDVPNNRRQEILNEFSQSTKENVLVAQINTAAHGLNIQFANIVVFCEPQIKPSLERQAVARAYRMGQTNNVFVYRLLTPDSIDEIMLDMLDHKQALFDAYADKSYMNEEAAKAEETAAVEKNMENKIIQLEKERLGISNYKKDNQQAALTQSSQ